MKKTTKLYIPIGISGSGKSYYLKNQFLVDFPEVVDILEKYDISLEDIVVSPDIIRREICGDVNSHEKETEVWALVRSRIKDTLNKYECVFFDATNISKKGRGFLKNYKKAEKIAILFKPNVSLSKERIKNDIDNKVDRSNVPFWVIDRQLETFSNSVLNDKNKEWDGVWNRIVENKAIDTLNKEFDKIIIL